MASHSPEADAAPWRALFFEMLRKTGNVSAAAQHAGRARAQLYRLRKQDKGTNSGDKYTATQFGVDYETVPGLKLGLIHTLFDGTAVNGRANSDGNATRLQVRLNF